MLNRLTIDTVPHKTLDVHDRNANVALTIIGIVNIIQTLLLAYLVTRGT